MDDKKKVLEMVLELNEILNSEDEDTESELKKFLNKKDIDENYIGRLLNKIYNIVDNSLVNK